VEPHGSAAPSAAPTSAGSTGSSSAPPGADAADLGAFLRLAVRRYGPDGVLWQQHPEVIPVPIRTWQVWNEPDHELYMPHTQNWPARYVELLKAAAQGIRAEDTGAKVMLAGFAGQAWIHLDWVYRNGARPWFDVAAVHPYTRDVADVVRIVRNMRAPCGGGATRVSRWP
jgi:hypothetical protein